jgi:hypothetical protein
MKGRDNLEDVDSGKRKWTGFIWLRIQTSCGML